MDESLAPERTLRIILRAHRVVINRLERLFEVADAPTIAEAVVLMCLNQSNEKRAGMQELSERLQLSRSGVSRLIDRMEEAGYIEREDSAADRRMINAVMTERGHDALRFWRDVFRAGYPDVFQSGMSGDELEKLLELLQKLANSIAPPAFRPGDFDNIYDERKPVQRTRAPA